MKSLRVLRSRMRKLCLIWVHRLFRMERQYDAIVVFDADNLVDANTKIGDSFTPKEKDTHSWTIDNDCDVIVYNTNGCHIYKIEVAAGAAGIQAVKTVKAGNGFIYNLAGQRVDSNYKGVVIKNGQKMIQK